MLVEHHIKYKEIHGIDETMWIENSDHIRLHRRLRREGRCKIPISVLDRISKAANARTNKGKDLQKQYKLNQHRHIFHETITENILLREILQYNSKTNTISWYSYFEGCNDKKLKEAFI